MVRAEALCRRRQLGRHQLHVQLASERIVQPIEQVLRICNRMRDDELDVVIEGLAQRRFQLAMRAQNLWELLCLAIDGAAAASIGGSSSSLGDTGLGGRFEINPAIVDALRTMFQYHTDCAPIHPPGPTTRHAAWRSLG